MQSNTCYLKVVNLKNPTLTKNLSDLSQTNKISLQLSGWAWHGLSSNLLFNLLPVRTYLHSYKALDVAYTLRNLLQVSLAQAYLSFATLILVYECLWYKFPIWRHIWPENMWRMRRKYFNGDFVPQFKSFPAATQEGGKEAWLLQHFGPWYCSSCCHCVARQSSTLGLKKAREMNTLPAKQDCNNIIS